MRTLHTANDTYALCTQWRNAGARIALVPTMGAYHQGHIELMRCARTLADRLIVSLFVNPAQFALDEDLAAYPRDFTGDAAIAQSLGVDAIFAPSPDAMYTPHHATTVRVPELSQKLCGQMRPTHFDGVCLVVLKLFMITVPHVAIFGEKDWQQLAIIRRMTHDCNIPVLIEGHPTVRETDGLAMSSRNVYLSKAERAQAPHIRQGLVYAQSLVAGGQTCANTLCDSVRQYWAKELPRGRVDYLAVVDKETLATLETIASTALMACAVRMGRARLIDNIVLL